MSSTGTDRRAAVWSTLTGAIGAVAGLIPHVAHHAGLLIGAAAITGAVGNATLAIVGLLASIPLLRRLHRRFRTWRAPAAALALFTAMFAMSALVIGPAISPSGEAAPATPAVTERPAHPASPSPEHYGHHGTP